MRVAVVAAVAVCLSHLSAAAADAPADPAGALKSAGIDRGICAVVGDGAVATALDLARRTALTVYVQAPPAELDAAWRTVDESGLLGTRVFVASGAAGRIGLADDLADAVIAGANADKAEVLRVLRPGGVGLVGTARLGKPAPAGVDDWSHPYHGPDNNPLSSDRLARVPGRTQFLAMPWYVPQPSVTVAAGGRVFRLFGHFASKRREWPWLGKLVAFNGYNGTILWQRELPAGFMVHRNVIVATADTVYLAEGDSCVLLNAATGEQTGEVAWPEAIGPDRCWKWLALPPRRDGRRILYALSGPAEPPAAPFRGAATDHGWRWGDLGGAYGGRPTKYPWGFGRTLAAIDAATKEVLWHAREDHPIDGRAVCMSADRLFYYSHGRFLACRDAATGRPLWKTSEPALLAAIGDDGGHGYRTGHTSNAYLKCTDKALYFAGPQRSKLVAVSAADGKVLWTDDNGNVQLVIRPEAVYAVAGGALSKAFDPLTGRVIRTLRFYREGCTRATGGIDSVWTRGGKGTVRLDPSSGAVTTLTPMRPPCTDGVIPANGLLHWGPWMCDCDLSLVGTIALAPRGERTAAGPVGRLERTDRPAPPADDLLRRDDWPTYRKDNARSAATGAAVPQAVRQLWAFTPSTPAAATAPVAAVGCVFTASADGTVRAINEADGTLRWQAHTGGAVMFPPTVSADRTYVGSADGWVYCLSTRTGERLWWYRVGPAERWIPIYGQLGSTWPVASGVLVADGVAYAAGGITGFDGTHVVALDAATGAVKWRNDDAGRGGVAVQGHLLLHQGRLYLAGGNANSPAAFDARTGSAVEAAARGNAYDLHRGRDLYLIAGKVVPSGHILYCPPADLDRPLTWAKALLQAGSGDVLVAQEADKGRAIVRLPAGAAPAGTARPTPLWRRRVFDKNLAIVVAADAALVLGLDVGPDGAASHALAALRLDDGEPIWRHRLPAPAVPWGLAVTRAGRIVLSCRDGRILCLGPAQ